MAGPQGQPDRRDGDGAPAPRCGPGVRPHAAPRPAEIPPALSTVLGEDAPTYVLPAAAPETELAAWRELVAVWQQGKPAARVVLDRELQQLPVGNALGAGLEQYLRDPGRGPADLAGCRRDGGGGHGGWPASRTARSIAGGWWHAIPTTRNGPSRCSPPTRWPPFRGSDGSCPTTASTGTWPSGARPPTTSPRVRWAPTGSPLVRALADRPMADLRLPRRTPLAELPPAFDGPRMGKAVAWLADPAREGRGLGSPGLAAATDWVEGEMRAAGLQPRGSDGFRQRLTWRGGQPEREMRLSTSWAVSAGAIRPCRRCWCWPTSTTWAGAGRTCGPATRARSTLGPTTTPRVLRSCLSWRATSRRSRRRPARWSSPC